MQTTRKSYGFTIVELLIVIVVIGILAAITIVSYNGIQTRSENLKTVTAVRSYAVKLMEYQVDKGHYPMNSGWPCLGPHPTSCGKRTAAAGANCIGGGAASSQAFYDEMTTLFGGTPPAPSTQQMTCNGNLYAGAWFHGSADGSSAEFAYYLKGDHECEPGGGLRRISRTFNTETTACHMALPAL